MVFTKRSCNLPLICQICGDVARGINFDVMTCMSCKAFFRRHAVQSINLLQCQFNNNCEITRVLRSGCSACRLRKCFTFGMNPQLIRYTSQNHRKHLKKKTRLLPTSLSLNLLQNDHSILTNDEWNLLSNTLHAYDQGNFIERAKHMLEKQLSLPPKLRSKPKVMLDIVGFFYSTVQSFVECVPYFNDLSIDARRSVIQHNSDTTGTFNSIFMLRETKAFDSSAYAAGCFNLYGGESFNQCMKFVSKLDQNGILVKLMLLVIAFSENSSIVTMDNTEHIATTTSSSSLIVNRIQNIFITLLWKYLNYQYGFIGAVKCFNYFIKFILNILRWTSETPHVQHWDMVDTLIENATRSLTISD